jgi:hypothetical protein
MSVNFSFHVQKRDGRYIFSTRQYGVVVRASDPADGIREFEQRVEAVSADFREASVMPDSVELESRPGGNRSWRSQYLPFFIKTAVIGAVGIWMLAVAANFVDESTIGTALRHPAQFIIRIGDTAERLPPDRLEEMKQAIRKIMTKINPLIEEIKSPARPPASGPRPPP